MAWLEGESRSQEGEGERGRVGAGKTLECGTSFNERKRGGGGKRERRTRVDTNDDDETVKKQ